MGLELLGLVSMVSLCVSLGLLDFRGFRVFDFKVYGFRVDRFRI